MGRRCVITDLLKRLWASALLFSPALGAEISIVPDRPGDVPIIVVSGELKDGDDKLFANIALPLDRALVVFDSPGGNLLAGIGIGKAARLKEFWTAVGDQGMCASACGLAWLGGIKRLASPGARIGFHAAFVQRDGAASESGAGNALVGAYLNQLGMSQTAIVYLTSAPPEDMQWLPLNDAASYGIDLEVVKDSAAPEAPPPQAQPSPPYIHPDARMVRLDGHDVLGFDLAGMPIRNVSRDDCEAACENQPACLAYTYNLPKHACFLKSGGARVLENVTAAAGYRPELQGRLFVSPLTIVEKTDFPGNDMGKIATPDFDTCLSACEREPRCAAFTFVKRQSVCWIKSAAGTPVENRRAVSGVRTKN